LGGGPALHAWRLDDHPRSVPRHLACSKKNGRNSLGRSGSFLHFILFVSRTFIRSRRLHPPTRPEGRINQRPSILFNAPQHACLRKRFEPGAAVFIVQSVSLDKTDRASSFGRFICSEGDERTHRTPFGLILFSCRIKRSDGRPCNLKTHRRFAIYVHFSSNVRAPSN